MKWHEMSCYFIVCMQFWMNLMLYHGFSLKSNRNIGICIFFIKSLHTYLIEPIYMTLIFINNLTPNIYKVNVQQTKLKYLHLVFINLSSSLF